MWHPDGPQGDETAKICHLVTPYTIGRGLDLGCGTAKLWPTTIGLDIAGGDIRGDARDLSMFADGGLDYVYSSHLLEHLPDPEKALAEWWRVIKVGGHLTLYLPHQDFYPRVGQPGANPDHKHDLSPEKVLAWMDRVAAASGQGFHLVECETRTAGDGREPFSEYSFLLVLRKRADGEITAEEPVVWPKDRRLLVVRYGGYGDAFIAMSPLKHLKAQGWHITVMTTPKLYEVLKANPYIDAFRLQDDGQIANGRMLMLHIDRLRERYGRILIASWEDGLLPDGDTIAWQHSQAVRDRLFNVNYLERMHEIAGVPAEDFDCRFYGDPSEAQLPPYDGPTIAWAIAGTGPHKFWPYIGQAVVRLLHQTNARIVLLGPPAHREAQQIIMEAAVSYYGPTRRLIGSCGATDMRGACAVALGADVVVGPETGILNAVATLPNRKVVFLSHSTPENLTKHWRNVTALIPDTPDYPDHRLHNERIYGKSGIRSPMDLRIDPDSGFPEIATRIRVETVVKAIMEALHGNELHHADRGEDGGRLDPELAQPGHGAVNGSADGSGSVDLPALARARDAVLDCGHAG